MLVLKNILVLYANIFDGIMVNDIDIFICEHFKMSFSPTVWITCLFIFSKKYILTISKIILYTKNTMVGTLNTHTVQLFLSPHVYLVMCSKELFPPSPKCVIGFIYY